MPYNKEPHEKAKKIYKRLHRKSYYANTETKMEGKTKGTGARIPEAKYKELQEISKIEGITVNALINISINQMLKRYYDYEDLQDKVEVKWLQDFDSHSDEEQSKILIKNMEKILEKLDP